VIPKRIHFVWIGDCAMPAWASRNLAEFQRLNPDHEIRVHGEDVLLPQFREAYDAAPELCSKADLLRYSALQRWGGWYFDLDFWPFRPVSDIERAYMLDGTRLFVTEQHGQKNPDLKIANGVLAAAADCAIWERIHAEIAQAKPPFTRCQFGPELMTRLVDRHSNAFIVGNWPWFYPAEIGRAGQVYNACVQAGNHYASRIAPTGGQLPFAMHLWAHGRSDITQTRGSGRHQFGEVVEGRKDGEFAGLRARLPMLRLQWQDETQPFCAIAEGLASIGCDVEIVAMGDAPQLDTTDLLVLWNGRKGQAKPWADAARRVNVPALYMEHGFFDRRAYSQIDHQDILHWASWADDLSRPAPLEGAERLARVWPGPLRPFRKRRGRVLVIGQVPRDSQMDESEIQLSTPLEKLVARALPRGVQAVFRPHPKAAAKSAAYLPRCGAATLKEAVEGARFAVMINSNSGAECLAWGCPVLCFGPALYAIAGVAKQATLATFGQAFREMLNGWRPDEEKARNFLEWLACRQWNQDELRDGAVLARLVLKVLTQ